ncbi:heterokaryon incompatibility protein-domain-containing protein [Neurospora tetraspora]|uniref:Heterokaryon incompatibility protein-domain-containing protein n=1 Tax=Neurospora tetraspora TaxID=94610 RepID=A0AAE0JBU3_9PEZI|nr:heterokaryon incompatibility protein-domain-containing protein [Neurospora tetraspora]
MFTYSPLSREKRETRFFQFTPTCQSGSGHIRLQLRHASLDDDALQYRALSYVWGDTKDKVDIEVNGEQFSVGENLHALLQMLQHHGVESWLWADAICIQQSDDDEKSWHVQSMCDIFKNAEFVYSWLGPGSEATDVAMNFFSDWGPRALKVGVMEKLWPTDIPMDGSFTLRTEVFMYLRPLERYFFPEPYWHRIWIFQEVALAREVLLICGEKFIPISFFEAVLEALWKFCGGLFTTFLNDFPLRRGFCERFPSHLYPSKAMLIRQLLCRGTKVSLGTILVAFSYQTERPWYRATDPRDIVYGILGLLSNDDRRSFGHVDYKNMTWVDLFTQATRSLIKTSLTSLTLTVADDVLYNIGHCLPRPRDQPSELPSWVPDWRDVGVNGLRQSLEALSLAHLDASDSRKDNHYHIFFGHGNPSAILLPGYRVDFVTDVMAYDYQARSVRERDRPNDWLVRIRDFTGLLESSDIGNLEGEDYVWRLVMDCHNANFLRLWLRKPKYKTEAACFIRRLMRLDYPDPQTLPDFLVKHIQTSGEFKGLSNFRSSKRMNNAPIRKSSNPDDDTSRGATSIVDGKAQTKSESVDPECVPDSISESDLRFFMNAKIRGLFRCSRSKNSTLFKTAKGMLGSGIRDVRPGDIVVILQNAHTPFILRPRPQDGDEIAADRRGSGRTFTFGGEAWVDGIITYSTSQISGTSFMLVLYAFNATNNRVGSLKRSRTENAGLTKRIFKNRHNQVQKMRQPSPWHTFSCRHIPTLTSKAEVSGQSR